METKVDLHVHSSHSDRPSEWLLRRIGAPECYTPPKQVYEECKRKGMDFVTISDHNTIDGALEIAHLPGTFLSAEVTTYFPEDGCKIHVLVSGISERQFEDIQRVRRSIYEFRDYVLDEGIVYSVAHPLFSVNDRLTVGHFERLLVLFKRFEGINGARAPRAAMLFRAIVHNLSPQILAEMAGEHDLDPRDEQPWQKLLTGGSDDHSGLYIASAYTRTPPAATVEELMAHLVEGAHEPAGEHGSSLMMGRNFYSIAYRFYRERLLGEDGGCDDLFSIMVGRLLRGEEVSEVSTADKLREAAQRFLRPRRKAMGQIDRALAAEVVEWVEAAETVADSTIEEKSFRTASSLAQQLSYAAVRKSIKHLKKGKLTESLQSIASLGPVALCSAPYLAAFQTQHKDEALHEEVAQRFAAARLLRRRSEARVWFTDTFRQVNGTALTIETCARIARENQRQIEVVTSRASDDSDQGFLRNFLPIGEFEIPDLESLVLSCPPFLEMIEYCEQRQFSEAIVSTPGPVGLVGLAAGKLLGMKLNGIYQSDYPLYLRYVTGSAGLEEACWRYVKWFYGQMDKVFVPSAIYRQELAERGVDAERIELLPRGLDRQLFNPDRRDPQVWARHGLGPGFKFLYVGTISEQKNLDTLLRAFMGMLEKGHRAHLVLAGNGPYLQALRTRYRRPEILFTGYVEDEELAALYASSDVLVAPATDDSFGNAVLEAQACALPVIVDTASSVGESVRKARSGWLVNMTEPGALQAAMARIARSDTERLKMQAAALEAAQANSWEALLLRLWAEPNHDESTESPPPACEPSGSLWAGIAARA